MAILLNLVKKLLSSCSGAGKRVSGPGTTHISHTRNRWVLQVDQALVGSVGRCGGVIIFIRDLCCSFAADFGCCLSGCLLTTFRDGFRKGRTNSVLKSIPASLFCRKCTTLVTVLTLHR